MTSRIQTNNSSKFHSPQELIQDIRDGKLVILVDDEDRENEGDLVLAAEHVSPELINFMAKEARGLICLALTAEQIEKLKIPLMVPDDLNLSPNKTAFTVSIEAAVGVSTGISAADRAHTIRVASNPLARPEDISVPGHIFPIRARAGGVIRRAGHTEGSVDLAKLAGLNPAAVICEVMNPDGSMARVPDLLQFAEKHQLKIGTIVDLIEYRLRHETLVYEYATHALPSQGGKAPWTLRVFKSHLDAEEHLVFQMGEVKSNEPMLVRVQVEDPVSDQLQFLQGSLVAWQAALTRVQQEGAGVLVLIRGQVKNQSLHRYLKNQSDSPNSPMDSREYGLGAQILRSLGIQKIRLMSRRPDRRVGLKAFGLEIIDVEPLVLKGVL